MRITLLCLAFIACSVSCKQNREIKVYRVAKEAASGSPHAASSDPHAGVPGMMPGGVMPDGVMADGADPHAGLTAEQLAAVGSAMPANPRFTDTPSAHWEKQPLSPMRLASYQIKGEAGAVVDISFSTLRSAPGGLLANVNRWRDQMGQAPIEEAELGQSSQTVKTTFGDAVVVDIEGLVAGADATKDGRLIGAIAEQDGKAWFFKMRGNAELTAAEKDNFTAWIQTVEPATGDAAAPAAPAASPPAADAPAGDGSVTWTLPEGWSVVSGSSARYATLGMSGADGMKGELAITHFPGDVGGDLANVNRWLQQIGLPAVDEAALAPLVSQVTAGPKILSVVDAKGAQTRLAAGWVRHGPDTWFFKFTGPDALVGAEKGKFTAFLESLRFNTPE